MPRNPSSRQVEASRANLAGRYGPKTTRGKKRAAQNGELNKGVKTAKARAKVIYGRWGAETETFYSLARCTECGRKCIWPSFSIRTLHGDLPLPCLEKILKERPSNCFYFFEGRCCVPSEGNDISAGPLCILDTTFLDAFKSSGDNCPELARREMAARRKTVAMKREMLLYAEKMKDWGWDAMTITPRMKYVMRYLRGVLRMSRPCGLEHRWRDRDEPNDVLEWIAEVEI